MNLRKLGGAALAVAVGLGVYFAWPEEKLSPEDEIRQLVDRAVKAAERREVAGVVKTLDERFLGPGGANRTEVKQLLVSQFFRAQNIVVMNPSLDVKVSAPTVGHFKGTFVFARDAAVTEASKYEIEADLEKKADGWRIVAASWNR